MPETFKLSQEECVTNGGHCYEWAGFSYPTYPRQYPEFCKHCGKKRIAIPQDNYRYVEE